MRQQAGRAESLLVLIGQSSAIEQVALEISHSVLISLSLSGVFAVAVFAACALRPLRVGRRRGPKKREGRDPLFRQKLVEILSVSLSIMPASPISCLNRSLMAIRSI